MQKLFVVPHGPVHDGLAKASQVVCAATNRATAIGGVVNRAAVNRAAVNRAAVNRAAVNRAVVNRAVVNRAVAMGGTAVKRAAKYCAAPPSNESCRRNW